MTNPKIMMRRVCSSRDSILSIIVTFQRIADCKGDAVSVQPGLVVASTGQQQRIGIVGQRIRNPEAVANGYGIPLKRPWCSWTLVATVPGWYCSCGSLESR
jgi:hypothetical protein